MASEGFQSGPLMDELMKYFDEQTEAASGKSAMKWFMREGPDGGEFEQNLRDILQDLDTEAYESYETAGGDGPFDASDGQVKVRMELLFVQSVLAGFRRRYVAGEESKPRSELDSRRYAMYSSKARKAMLNRFKDLLEE